MKKFLILLYTIGIFIFTPLFAHKIPVKGSCPVCGMYIKEFKDTRTEAIFKNGEHYIYCGVACLLRDINEHGGIESLKGAWVTDWITKKSIPYNKAVFVIGSDLIPDMLPNIIAFKDKLSAENFIKQHGGVIKSFEELLNIISPVGLTVPFRIPPAAVPSKNVFKIATGFKYVFKNTIYNGDDDISTIKVLKKHKKTKTKFKIIGTSLKVGYGITDNLAMLLTVPRIYKKVYIKSKNGKKKTFTSQRLGDTEITFRYRLVRDSYFDKHFGILFGVTLPTGEYNEKPPVSPEAFAVKSGIMYSQHYKFLWFHTALTYKYFFENNDNFQKGEVLTFGFALHYTIDYDNIFGMEFDFTCADRDEDHGKKLRSSGYVSSTANILFQRKIAKFGGGNLTMRALFGIPIYQNFYGIQLGEDYHFQIGLGWKRKF